MKVLDNASVNTQGLIDLIQKISQVISGISDTKDLIKCKYEALGSNWNDKKYHDLGQVVNDCTKALNDLLKILLQTEKYLCTLVKSVQEYENVKFGSGASGLVSNNYSIPSSESANPSVAVKLAGKSWTSDLSIDEKSAVRDYTGSAYSNINAFLRGICDEWLDGNKEKASLIHSALSRSSIPQSCTVYRGASVAALGDCAGLSDNELIGQFITDDGFMSTSIERGDAFGGDITFVISVPEGARGAYVGYISHCGHYESEVLFDMGRSLIITNVERDSPRHRIIYAQMG